MATFDENGKFLWQGGNPVPDMDNAGKLVVAVIADHGLGELGQACSVKASF